MNQPINLNKIRKAVEKVKKEEKSAENVVKHGRSKAERVFEATQNAKMRAVLDRHRTDEE